MVPNYSEALCEVSYIINNLDKSDYNKIPAKFVEFVEKNKSKYYAIKFNMDMPYETLELKRETLAILAIVYRKFLSPIEKRDELNKRFYDKLKEEKVKFTADRAISDYSLFNGSSNNYVNYDLNSYIEKSDNNLLQIKSTSNEKWYTKICSKIKKFIFWK